MGKTTCGFSQPDSDRVIFASTHADPDARAKQKAELEFRAGGKQRRYAWDYDAWFDIYSARQDGSDLVNLTDSPGYDAEGAFSPDGKTNRFLFAAVRVPDRKTFARTARTLRQRSVVVRRHLHQSKMIHWPVRDSSPPLGMTPQRGMIYLWCQFLVDLVRL